MSTTSMVHVRIDDTLKEQATETFAAMGLSISDAVRVFLMRSVAEKCLPFELRIPNTKTLAAMEEADKISKAHIGRFETSKELFDDLEENCR